ncbi:MAG: elongation factor P maturation arginine rhamnosyltransferase EarP [Burkholderiales bacterium]|nr:elongation factor P maturation arginine rhamnosyltransferase EarP [Burkholderiales bacterium]
MTERWDIFCRIVDNYGDVGVSWRLARQVAREHKKRARLWLDDLTVLAKLRPEVDPSRDVQQLEQVEIRRIREPFDATEVADVVVETFGCDPPDAYVQAMAARAEKPHWINLEYLSAEEWVEASHALPSPNPRLPLVKHFFFPGFTPRTGGLLREESLIRRRDEFQGDAGAQAAFWRGLVGEAPPEDALKLSLFNYTGAPVESLARASVQYPGPVWLVAPEGVAATALERWRQSERSRESNRIFVVPFLPQDRYDLLLWACDVNFVRGEDSFVRAQWAGKPMVWHVYPQDDDAHWVKLAAFLARYTAGLDRSHAAAVTSLWEAWNRREPAASQDVGKPALGAAWAEFAGRREALEAHARAWCASLDHRRDLAAELVDFVDNTL